MKRIIYTLALATCATFLQAEESAIPSTAMEYADDDCMPSIEMKSRSKKKKNKNKNSPVQAPAPVYSYGSFSFSGALAINAGGNEEVPFSPVKIGSQATGLGVTSDGNGTITVAKAGTYLISLSLEADAGAGSWKAVLQINNNQGENSLVASATGGNHTVSSQSVFSLGSNSTLNISINNTSDAVLSIVNGTINVVQIAP